MADQAVSLGTELVQSVESDGEAEPESENRREGNKRTGESETGGRFGEKVVGWPSQS